MHCRADVGLDLRCTAAGMRPRANPVSLLTKHAGSCLCLQA